MTMKTRNSLLVIIATSLTLHSLATAEVPPIDLETLIAQAPPQEKYPGADAVLLYQRITYNIDGDGRLTRRVHQLHKLFTAWSCRNLSDLRLGWDTTHQELVIHTCRTRMRDGRVVDTPERGFNEVTPDAVAPCPDFLSYREKVISHVGVETGSIIELDYEVRDLAAGPLPASGLEFLQGELPILIKQVVIRAPSEMFLTWHGVHTAPDVPQISHMDDQQIITWTVRDMPALPREGNWQRRGDYLPHVLFTTAPDLTILANQMDSLTKAATLVSPTMRSWLDQTEDDAQDAATDLTELDTVQRIAKLLGSRIRTLHPVDRGWGRAPRGADAVFESSCGTEWEKAILGYTLLREAGLNPELAFFSRWNSFTPEIATPLSFGQLRLVVAVAGDNYWLSPDSDEAFPGRSDLVGKTGLFLEDSPRKFRTYVVPAFPSRCTLVVELRPGEEGGFQAEIDLRATGLFWQPDWKKATDDIAASLAAAVLQDGEVVTTEILQRTPVDLHLRVEVAGSSLAEDKDGLLTVLLPVPPRTLASLLPSSFQMSSDHRQTPLYLDQELSEEITLRLTLPEQLTPDFLPASVELESAHGNYSLKVIQNGNLVKLTQRLELPAGVIPPESYPEFHRLVARAAEPAAGRIVLLSE